MKKNIWILAGLTIAASSATTSGAFAANAKICWEAENFVSTVAPVKKTLPGVSAKYSGKGYLDIPWDRNLTKGKGYATYKFNVKTPGVYSVWARVYWANGCGNSIGVSVNGGPMARLGEDGTYDSWHWVGGGPVRVQLKAGINTLVLHNTETGPRVDQFFLCQDPDYTPTGIRKITP